jgi:hypothetical protein
MRSDLLSGGRQNPDVAIARPQGAFTAVFNELWTRVNAPIAHPGYAH